MRALLLLAAACGTVASDPDAQAPADGATADGNPLDATAGTGVLGDACTRADDCDPDWTCRMLSADDTEGICTQVCTTDAPCAAAYVGPGTPFCSSGVFANDHLCLIRCVPGADCRAPLVCGSDAICRPASSQPENFLGEACSIGAACATGYTCLDFGGTQGFCSQGCSVTADDCDLAYTGPGSPVCGVDTTGDGLSDHCEISCNAGTGCPDGLMCINLTCLP